MARDSASPAPGTRCDRDLGESTTYVSLMAQVPEPASGAPKRANVGPRQAVEPSSSQVPRYPVAPEGSAGISSSGDPEFRTDVLSVLYVKVGKGADLQSLIGSAVSSHGGSNLGTDRDGFAALFSSPSSSIATALALRKEMASMASSGGDTIVAQIGVHTGCLLYTSRCV